MKSVEDSIPLSIKHFWTYVSNKKGSTEIPANMFLENLNSNNPTEICNMFAIFFTSVYEPTTFNPAMWQPPETYADNAPCISEIYLPADVVHKAITQLDLNKGPGPDGLPPVFIKRTAETIALPLHIVFNKCLREGTFPDIWKRAHITPVFKSGVKNNIENYRPISILSTLSKLFESLVHSEIYSHIHNLIIGEQHGFVKRRSTNTNLMLFTDFLFKRMDEQVQVDAVYTDFRKAFDRVDHKLLLDKIAYNGIRGNLLRWFMAYIHNRSQKIVINGFQSSSIIVTSGVPQGSIMGPLLFILFVNDIKSYFINSRFLMYADDIKIYKSCKSTQDCQLLQEDLDRLSRYCSYNKLQLSLPKCNAITFTKNKNIIRFDYSLNGITLRKVDHIRDLGVEMDSKLHFNLHIDNIINKAYRMFGFVMRSSNDFKRPSTFLILYKALVRSQLEFAVSIWSPIFDVYIKRMEMVQKKYLRAMQYRCTKSKLPYTQLLTRYKLQSLESRRNLLMVMMLHGLCHNRFDCPDITNNLCYIVPRTVMRREARVPQLFHTARCRTHAGARAPLRRIVDTYNTHFIDFDIFALTHYNFKKMAIESLE